jgi:hypothetical protein
VLCAGFASIHGYLCHECVYQNKRPSLGRLDKTDPLREFFLIRIVQDVTCALHYFKSHTSNKKTSKQDAKDPPNQVWLGPARYALQLLSYVCITFHVFFNPEGPGNHLAPPPPARARTQLGGNSGLPHPGHAVLQTHLFFPPQVID